MKIKAKKGASGKAGNANQCLLEMSVVEIMTMDEILPDKRTWRELMKW